MQKEVMNMKRVLAAIAFLAFVYGKAGAGMASRHGVYEEPVPAVLQK